MRVSGRAAVLGICAALAVICDGTPLAAKAVAATKTVELGPIGKEAQIFLSVGDTLRIILPANPSTGYAWQLAADGSALQAGEVKMTPPESSKPGAPSRQSMAFKAKTDGPEKLTLTYARPWEKQKPPAKTFVVQVSVSAAARNSLASAVKPEGVMLAEYSGKLPCADCSGILQTISIYTPGANNYTDAYYVSTSIYEGREIAFVTASSWSLERGDAVDPDATVYSLDSNTSASHERYLLQGDTLVPLGSDGKPIQSPFNMSLKRVWQ